MFKILQTSLFAVLVVTSYTALSFMTPKDILKKGTKLVYDVNYNGTQYEFIVTIKDQQETYTFDWSMGVPVNKSGTVSITQDALENADGLFNYFSSGSIHLADQSCFMLSRKMYNAFSDKGSMIVYTNKKANEYSEFGNAYNHTQTFDYKNSETQEFYCRTVTDKDDYQITYVNDASFPLIIEMNLGWTLKLKTIYN
jgi:hypothetical protein